MITAAGNLTHDQMVELAREHFERLRPTATARGPPREHARIALRNKKSLEQAHMCLGVPSYPLPHEERLPATS